MTRYFKPPAFVRNDGLTAGTYGQMLANGRAIEEVLTREHRVDGEHNTPFIARTLGTVLASAGPTYDLTGFNPDASLGSGHNPSVGKLILTLASGRYYATAGGPLMVQNASALGDTRPELSWARWFDDTRVEIYTDFWEGTLGSALDETWSTMGCDSSFHLAVHSGALSVGAALDWGHPLQRRLNGLVEGEADRLIQASADLQVAMDSAHTDGVHDTREVAKLWAHLQFNGTGFNIVDQVVSDSCDAGEIEGVDVTSTGKLNVRFTNSFVGTKYQVFVDVDYARLTGANDDYFICCAPHDERNVDNCYLYFYEQLFSGDDEYWDRGHAVDFHIWVFDDH